MPELPEVETIRRGLLQHLKNKTITQAEIFQYQLRWPIPENMTSMLANTSIKDILRRGKYLIFLTDKDFYLIVHLGMSGALTLQKNDLKRNKHDHVIIHFSHGESLVYHDPRRFGALLITNEPWQTHRLLKSLGPEPLDDGFDATTLINAAKNSRRNIKSLIMDSCVVTGVGNIYANEALFLAHIHPEMLAGMLSKAHLAALTATIKDTLATAISAGGTTLKDFKNPLGKPGYFQQQLMVYGKGGQPCPRCQAQLIARKIGGRQSTFCPTCQPLP